MRVAADVRIVLRNLSTTSTERGGGVVLKAIDQPTAQFGSLLDLFEQVLAHEKEVTVSIYKLYDLTVAEKDAAQVFLQWYVTEQVEEEKAAAEIVSMLKLADDRAPALLVVDCRMAQRAKS